MWTVKFNDGYGSIDQLLVPENCSLIILVLPCRFLRKFGSIWSSLIMRRMPILPRGARRAPRAPHPWHRSRRQREPKCARRICIGGAEQAQGPSRRRGDVACASDHGAGCSDYL